MLIKYIGNKIRKTDNVNFVFGRSWTPGSVLEVPDADGAKLLKFPTIWAEENAGAPPSRFEALTDLADEQLETMRETADKIAAPVPEFVPTKFEPDDSLAPTFDAARAISAAPPLNETSAMGDYLDGFDVAQLEAMRAAEAAGKARGTMDKHLGYAIKRKQ